MKLSFLIKSLIFGIPLSSAGSADTFYHEREFLGPSVWAFGNSGVSIYTIDGSKELKQLKNTDICKLTDRGQDCGFKGVVSDGKRYVFASNWQGNSTIDVFSMNTGDFVASLPTCGNPWDVDYHPVRDEVWVHCWGPDEAEGDVGHVDVFSASAIGTALSQIPLHDDLVGHAHGSVVVDSSLGHVGYATDLNTPFLYKMDLNDKKVISQKEMPDVNGLYRMGYSHVNKHIYLRSYVCCSCGFEGADLPACGRGGGRPVNVTTGPNPGINLEGTCGHGCEGSPADSIGVYEYDTNDDHIVGNWQIRDGFGADPYVSPYGDFVALFGNNGGSTVRLLKPSMTGGLSKLWADVEVGFNTEGPSIDKAVSDSVFIQDSKHNVAIFTSTLSNSIVIVDLSGDTPITRDLLLSEGDEITSNHGRGARRNVVWAVGTDYVWVDAEVTEEFHIIKLSPDGDVNKATLERTINGVPARRLVYVENYQVQKEMEIIQEQIDIRLKALEEQMNEKLGEFDKTLSSASSTSFEKDTEVVSSVEKLEMEDESIDTLGLTGLIIAVVSVLLGLMNVVLIMRVSGSKKGGNEDKFQSNLDFE